MDRARSSIKIIRQTHLIHSQQWWSRGGLHVHMLKSQIKKILHDFVLLDLMPGCWRRYCLTDTVHYSDVDFVCFLNWEILYFWFTEVLHDWQYWQRPPLRGQMQRHEHTPFTTIDSQMSGLYLINTAWQKIKCNSEKSSDQNLNECRNASSPNSMDLASPLHRICDEDVHSYF